MVESQAGEESVEGHTEHSGVVEWLIAVVDVGVKALMDLRNLCWHVEYY